VQVLFRMHGSDGGLRGVPKMGRSWKASSWPWPWALHWTLRLGCAYAFACAGYAPGFFSRLEVCSILAMPVVVLLTELVFLRGLNRAPLNQALWCAMFSRVVPLWRLLVPVAAFVMVQLRPTSCWSLLVIAFHLGVMRISWFFSSPSVCLKEGHHRPDVHLHLGISGTAYFWSWEHSTCNWAHMLPALPCHAV
jgi:hypothetical protein